MSWFPHFHQGGCRVLTWLVAGVWASSLLPEVLGEYTPFLPQGFFFDWTPQGQTPPVPTTAQCDSIHISWSRGAATGPNPTAPYFLQVFTSAFIVPFSIPVGNPNSLTFDWPVPFIPGTQYQICMWDSNGVSGGCQATYTVYQAPNHTFQDPPVCTNLSYPHPDQVLGVKAVVDNGPISQFGWVDQCTDISLTPTNGTPPFTLTVAPALHPPYNITSHTMDSINWTVSLSWGMPFFISLSDSTGLTWANGPLHSGGGGPTTCLSQTNAASETTSNVKPWVAVVSGIAGLLFGLVVGLIGAVFLLRRWRGKRSPGPNALHRKSSSMSITTPVLSSPPDGGYRDVPTPGFSSDNSREHMLPRDPSYRIEPFVLPTDQEFGQRPSHSSRSATQTTLYDAASTSQPHSAGNSHSRSPSVTSPTSTAPPTLGSILSASRSQAEEARGPSQVYVVHHDAGRPPVTVYTADGTEVVELPPRYNESASGSGPRASPRPGAVPPLQIQERRQTGSTPSKLPPTRRVVN